MKATWKRVQMFFLFCVTLSLIWCSTSAFGNDLVVDFGSNGFWQHDGDSWSKLSSYDADSMITWEKPPGSRKGTPMK